jgi:hypothetical protein
LDNPVFAVPEDKVFPRSSMFPNGKDLIDLADSLRVVQVDILLSDGKISSLQFKLETRGQALNSLLSSYTGRMGSSNLL